MAQAGPTGERIFRGIPVSGGVCRGKILVLDRPRPAISRREIPESEVAEEINRVERALATTRTQLLEVQRRVSAALAPRRAAFLTRTCWCSRTGPCWTRWCA